MPLQNPLQGSTVDVPIAPINQQAPTSGGPVGRLKQLIDGKCSKFTRADNGAQAGSAQSLLRVEKRDGWNQLTRAVRSPVDGSSQGNIGAAPSLLDTFGGQLLEVIGDVPHVLAENQGAWQKFAYTAPTEVLRQRNIYAQNSQAWAPSAAYLSGRTLFAWYEVTGTFAGVRGEVVDDDGTPIRAPFNIIAGSFSVKVISDGTRFWVFSAFTSGSNLLNVSAFDVNGVALGASITIGLNGAQPWWDVTFFNGSVVVAQTAGVGVQFNTVAWNGSTITNAAHTDVSITSDQGGVSWLTNNTGDGKAYLSTVHHVGVNNNTVFAWRINTSLNQDHQFTVGSTFSDNLVNVAGYVVEGGGASPTVVAVMSVLDATPNAIKNLTFIQQQTFGGALTNLAVLNTVTAVSRVFKMNGRYVAAFYYGVFDPDSSFFVSGTAQANHQPCFFLVDVQPTASNRIVGRWEYLLAFADWQATTTPTSWFDLSSPYQDAAGAWHMALAYRAESFTTETRVAGGASSDVGFSFAALTNTVGIKDYSFGPDNGQAVEFAGELLLPGPQASVFNGKEFAPDGLPLAPQILTVLGTGAGGLTTGQRYEFVAVYEGTDSNGNRKRSPPSQALSRPLAGGATAYQLTGIQPGVMLGLANISVSLYRTVFNAGVMSAEHHKITNDLAPLYADPTTLTWAFTDTMSDATATVNEILYTDKDMLERHPAPPFRSGASWQNRAWVVGYDGAVWFSGEKTEGDALWFSPRLRILLPSGEQVGAIAPMDSFLLLLGASGRMFYIERGALPDATFANGSIPTPVELPFTQGCTGFSALTSEGLFYSSTQGGIWLITRQLTNVYVGAPVDDDAKAGTVVGMASDNAQRLAVAVKAGGGFYLLVWDSIAGAWYRWSTTFNDPTSLLVAWNGAFVVSDVHGANVLTPGQVGDKYDNGGGLTTQTFATITWIAFLHLGGVRNFKRLWNTQMLGEFKGDHDMTVTTYVDDDYSTPLGTPVTFTPDSTKPYTYDIPPMRELLSSVSYKFVDSFPRTPSAGYTLEMLSFYVGLEKGLNRLPAARKIMAT